MSAASDSGAAPTVDPRTVDLRIVHGGQPGPEQLAALVLALTPVAAAGPPPSEPAWGRAFRLEATGGARLVRPSDLHQRVR